MHFWYSHSVNWHRRLYRMEIHRTRKFYHQIRLVAYHVFKENQSVKEPYWTRNRKSKLFSKWKCFCWWSRYHYLVRRPKNVEHQSWESVHYVKQMRKPWEPSLQRLSYNQKTKPQHINLESWVKNFLTLLLNQSESALSGLAYFTRTI